MSTEKPNFCPHCGTAIVGEMRFCTVCGKQTRGEPIPQAASPTKKNSRHGPIS